MNSHDENSYDVNSYDIMKSYIQWCWCLFPLTGITTSSCQPPFYVDYAKMALPLTHSSVNGPLERLTWFNNGLHHKVYTLEKEYQCHPPHESTLQCHRTVHVHWLCKLLLYMSQSCAHILKPLTDQSGLIPTSWTDKMQKAFVQCVCLWLQEHSLSWQ